MVVFDIDNTIADTWPSFLKTYESEIERLNSIKPFSSMINLVNFYSELQQPILFLTARDYRYYYLTRAWLDEHIKCRYSLVMVSVPLEKVKILKQFRNCKVEYYDDLTHSHETGEIGYYCDVINQVKSIPNVKYYDYHRILELQGKN